MLSLININSSVNDYNSSKYVDGPMRKKLESGGAFTFPIGNGDRYGKLEIISTTSSGSQFWGTQYYDDNPDNNTSLDTSEYENSLERVSGNEYWRVNGPGSGSAQNKIRWDSYSLLPAMTDDRPNDLKMVEWITSATPSQWEIVSPATVTDNGVNDGTITSDDKLDLNGDHYFTLGTTIETSLPSAGFLTQDTAVCDNGDPVTLRVQLAGGEPPWTIYVWDDNNSTTITESNINSEEYSFDVTPGATNTYTIDSVSDNAGITSSATIFGDPVTVTVNSLPQNYTLSGGANICSNDSTELQLNGSQTGIDYEVYRDDGSIQLVNVISGTGSSLSLGYYQTAGDYTVTAVNPSTGCTRDMGVETITLTQAPDPEPTAAIGSVCFDNGATVDTLDANDVEGVGDSFTWSPDSSLTLNIEGDTAYYQPDWNPKSVSVERWFKVTVEGNGCSATDSLNIELFRKPETGNQYYVPNEFDQ